MSAKKNKKILDDIAKENYLGLNKEAIINRMQEHEVAGQRVFYSYFVQKTRYDLNPEEMDKNMSDGIVGNAIIECKLDEKEGGGTKKAYEELYFTIPKRLKQKGERIPYYRCYVELKTFSVEVYDCHCNLIEKFDWYDNPDNFRKFFDSTKETYEYDLTDEDVDIVEVIQNIYKCCNIKSKKKAYEFLEKGIIGWFKPFDIKKTNINRLILNNDRMNEKYVQKMEGAFFTPPRYIKISTKYVLNAIQRAKEEGYDDFVIIDRCAGVGNLESQFDESIYPHLILGTINEAEALTANIRFGDLAQVEVIDALSKNGVDFYKNAIKKYKKNNNVKKLAVILLENPPYAQLNSNKKGGLGSKGGKTWVHQQLERGGEDLDEQFVLSAYKFYNPYAYIHYGPIKIWKSRHLIDKEVKEAYLCNRKYFNAGESSIALLSWANNDKQTEEIYFDNDFGDTFVVKKVHKPISELFADDGRDNGICCIEARNYGFAFPRLTGSLNSDGKYGTKWIKKENLLKVAPLFCASRDEVSETGKMPDGKKDYRIIDTTFKSSDGGIKYQEDMDFLQDCLLYAICTQKNSCDSKAIFWKEAYSLLDKKRKENKIWILYYELVSKTALNGLANIETYKKEVYGKLWKEHNLKPKIDRIKELLKILHFTKIRPKLIKYEILK